MSRLLSLNPGSTPKALLLGVLLGTAGCGGSVNAKGGAQASTQNGAESEANFDAHAEADGGWDTTQHSMNEEQTNATARSTTPQAPGEMKEGTLLGARHDLSLAATGEAHCECLAVSIGPETSASFVWSGIRPTLDRSKQLAIAINSEGVECTSSKAGASYMGYELKDGDVIVKVEAAVAGRPVTRGAIIPRPAVGKQVYVEPVGGVPFGKGLSGGPRCSLGSGN
jgi:hypothetical protein